jgi:hypothetical protein
MHAEHFMRLFEPSSPLHRGALSFQRNKRLDGGDGLVEAISKEI